MVGLSGAHDLVLSSLTGLRHAVLHWNPLVRRSIKVQSPEAWEGHVRGPDEIATSFCLLVRSIPLSHCFTWTDVEPERGFGPVKLDRLYVDQVTPEHEPVLSTLYEEGGVARRVTWRDPSGDAAQDLHVTIERLEFFGGSVWAHGF